MNVLDEADNNDNGLPEQDVEDLGNLIGSEEDEHLDDEDDVTIDSEEDARHVRNSHVIRSSAHHNKGFDLF